MPQVKSDTPDAAKEIPQDLKDTQEELPQVKSDTPDEPKQIPQALKDFQAEQPQIKSDTPDAPKQIPQDLKDTQAQQPQIKSDAKELKTETEIPAQGKSDTPQDAPQRDKGILSVGEKIFIPKILPKEMSLLEGEELPAEISFVEEELPLETKKPDLLEEELSDKQPPEIFAAGNMNYFFVMNAETLLAAKPVADEPKVDGVQNLMTLVPQTKKDNAQSMLNMLGSRAWRPIEIQPVEVQPTAQIQVQPQATVQVQPQPTVQIQPQSTVQIQPQPTAQAQPQATAQVQAQPTAQVQPQPTDPVQPQPIAQIQPQPTAQVQPQPITQIQPQATAQIQPQANVQIQPQANVQVQPQAIAQVQPQPIAQIQPQPTAPVQPQPIAQIQPQPIAQIQPQPIAQIQPQPTAQVQPQPIAQIQPQAIVEVQSQPTAQVQPQPTVEVQNIVSQPIVQVQAQANVIQPRVDERPAQQIFSEMLGVNVQVEEAPTAAPVTPPQSPPQNFNQDSRQQDTQQNFQQQTFQPTISDAPQVQQVSTGGEVFTVPLTASNDTPQIQQATPAQAPDAPPPMPQDNFDVPAQIVRQARLIRTTENTQMVIKLNPEHLGELTLRISVSQNGAVNASFHSDNAQVRTIIENSLVQLRQELNNAGLKIENVQVYAGLSDGGLSNGQGGQAWQQNRQQRQGTRRINLNALEREVDNAQPVNESSATDGVDYSV